MIQHIHLHYHSKVGVIFFKMFLKRSLLLTKAVFDQRYNKKSNISYYYTVGIEKNHPPPFKIISSYIFVTYQFEDMNLNFSAFIYKVYIVEVGFISVILA